MKNAFTISSIAAQAGSVCTLLVTAIGNAQSFENEGHDVLVTECMDTVVDELSHLQSLVIRLTELVTETSQEIYGVSAENNDGEGSVFAEGELQSVKEVDDNEEEVSKDA